MQGSPVQRVLSVSLPFSSLSHVHVVIHVFCIIVTLEVSVLQHRDITGFYLTTSQLLVGVEPQH